MHISSSTDREEHLLQDCEWKLRKTERSCKDRVVEAERTRTEAIERMKQIEKDVKKQLEEVCFHFSSLKFKKQITTI